MAEIEVVRYDESYRDKWDKFVLEKTMNGTFLQSRKFLEYHKDRFIDHSLLFIKCGTIIAVCPAIEKINQSKKEFLSHLGSTFGGLIFGKEFYTISYCTEVIDLLNKYLEQQGFEYSLLKSTGDIFCKTRENNLINYLLFTKGYGSYKELSFAIDLTKIDDVVANFHSKTRNLYKTSLKNNLKIRECKTDEEIKTLHEILCKSLLKYDTKPVHTYEELLDLYHNRINEFMRFYGIYHEDNLVAGTMVFIINDVFHTQYLFADPDYLYLKPMDFMDGSLIQIAFEEKFKYFSFGISTENHGTYLNETLAKFKEGFGTGYYINETFYK